MHTSYETSSNVMQKLERCFGCRCIMLLPTLDVNHGLVL